MKIEQINERIENPAKASFLYVKEIDADDQDQLEEFVDTFNMISDELAGSLRMGIASSKLRKGKAWIMYDGDTDTPVGVCALKYNAYMDFGSLRTREVGYLAISESYRGYKNLMTLLKPVIVDSRKYDMVYISTRSTNRTMKALMNRARLVEFAFTARSPFSSNLLDYWVLKTAKKKVEVQVQALKDEPRIGAEIVEEQKSFSQRYLSEACDTDMELVNESTGIHATVVEQTRYTFDDHKEVIKARGLGGWAKFALTGDVRNYKLPGFSVFLPENPEVKAAVKQFSKDFQAVETDSYRSSVKKDGEPIAGTRYHFVFPTRKHALNARKFLHDMTGDYSAHNLPQLPRR